jgi:uncharacterized protein YrrD
MRLIKDSDFIGCEVHASDGDIGRVSDIYFDDETWTVRYFVVKTGAWLFGRRVLVSLSAVKEDMDDCIHTTLTREQVKRAPDADTEKPISRRYELEYAQHFGWPPYWRGAGLWGPGPRPGSVRHGQEIEEPMEVEEDLEASRLRSLKEIIEYCVMGKDDEIGHVDDFLVDDESWKIQYVVVDCGKWFKDRLVLMAPAWMSDIHWPNRSISTPLTREQAKAAPRYKRGMDLSEEFLQQNAETFGKQTQAR